MRMNDREMLLLLYGALKIKDDVPGSNLERIVKLVEDHLWPPMAELPPTYDGPDAAVLKPVGRK